MYRLEVDFEVYKLLTMKRATEEVTYNDVIRELLGLRPAGPAAATVPEQSLGDWVVKGVRFPAGTEFRSMYKGQLRSAVVEGGALRLNGKSFDSPSSAASSITNGPVNGWNFWECRLPGKSNWQVIARLREE